MFNDDLTSEENGSEFDIVCVYRGCNNAPTGFGLHVDEDLIYCRDKSYIKTHTYTHNESTTIPNNKDMISVVMQAMYGNRTGMQLGEEDINRYVLGYLSFNLPIDKEFDGSIIQIPNTKCVIVYNKYQEEKTLQDKEYIQKRYDHTYKPLAVIPELNITLYSKCFMCRMDDDGNLTSLEDGDGKYVVKYLSE